MLKTAVLLCCCLAAALGAAEGAVAVAADYSAMPLLKASGRFSLGTIKKMNWFEASDYCRSHGLHLASINSATENGLLEDDIRRAGLENESFWTSGTDQAREGTWRWMSTGGLFAYKNWQSGQPDNTKWSTCKFENCLALLPVRGLQWNDAPCVLELYFVCETQ